MLQQLKRLRERITPTDIVMWLIGAVMLAMIIWGSAATLTAGRYTRYHWFDFLIFGLAQGSIYALIAMGYTIVYGVLRMINFAHSEVFMSGPYTAYYVAAAFYSSGFLDRQPILCLIVIFLVAMATSTLIAFLLERVAYRPLRNRTPFDSSHHCYWSLLLSSIYLSGALWFRFPGLSSGEDDGRSNRFR